jgi:hypothetical protein
MANVVEIAVRRVKSGQQAAFRSRRAAFIGVLKQQSGVNADREFESFHALPAPDDAEVFVGMTDYDDLKTVARIQRRPGVVWRFLRFALTMDLKAYVFATQSEGPNLDLASLAGGPGQILEVAVRRIKDPAGFDTARKQFIEGLTRHDGVVESHELTPVKGKDIDGITIGMTVYASREAFEKASGELMADPVTQRYFSTFDPIAIQYCVSTTNR